MPIDEAARRQARLRADFVHAVEGDEERTFVDEPREQLRIAITEMAVHRELIGGELATVSAEQMTPRGRNDAEDQLQRSEAAVLLNERIEHERLTPRHPRREDENERGCDCAEEPEDDRARRGAGDDVEPLFE